MSVMFKYANSFMVSLRVEGVRGQGSVVRVRGIGKGKGKGKGKV